MPDGYARQAAARQTSAKGASGGIVVELASRRPKVA
jgi:hypothetical protein